MRRFAPLAVAAFLAVSAIATSIQPDRAVVPQQRALQPSVKPAEAKRNADKVYLEHADRLLRDESTFDESGSFQVLVGNVKMRKGGMVMTCDSAHFYDGTNSFEAFSNVRMEQGDTLFVYADQLYYDGLEEIATLYANAGKTVRLINRDVTLRTYVFYYDLADEVAYYDNWGELTDRQNKLTSIEGEYHPSTKDAWFYKNVDLESPRQNDVTTMHTDSLNYNTGSRIAEIISPTVITNSDGEILTSSGTYNTQTGVANLYERSTVKTTRGNTLTGDTLFFDRETGIGEAFGNMVLTDSARQSSLHGNYGYYNDFIDSAFVTGRAMAKEYSQGDTLYLHGDTINAYVEVEGTDSTKVTNVFHNVRFYRSDIQGLCDSLSATDSDSLLRMYRHPILWSGERQIFGNVIFVHSNDSTPDWARLPESGIMSEHIAEDCYNQLAGTDMTVWFNDSTIDRLYIEGNVQMFLFPMENDSTYNKYVYVESSFMDAYFDGRKPRKINFWPETPYDIVPLYLAKRSDYKLQRFRDFGVLRPTSPDDIFNVSDAMKELFTESTISEKSLRHRRVVDPPKMPEPPAAEPSEMPEEAELAEPDATETNEASEETN